MLPALLGVITSLAFVPGDSCFLLAYVQLWPFNSKACKQSKISDAQFYGVFYCYHMGLRNLYEPVSILSSLIPPLVVAILAFLTPFFDNQMTGLNPDTLGPTISLSLYQLGNISFQYKGNPCPFMFIQAAPSTVTRSNILKIQVVQNKSQKHLLTIFFFQPYHSAHWRQRAASLMSGHGTRKGNSGKKRFLCITISKCHSVMFILFNKCLRFS